jgi:hypothetical protein
VGTRVFWYVIFCAFMIVVKGSGCVDLGMHKSTWDHCMNCSNLVSCGCMLFMLMVSMAKSLT